ncbi:MAG: NAD(P) transhydrogenase subunit alpha [Holosporales bacterium]|jgi:NAD(P) transhydrogenase subunit alpha|nr:NAD(P) transhydrogenase subunit alpha [Holosporales bacterium]
MKIFVIREDGERRVALTPEICQKVIDAGFEVTVADGMDHGIKEADIVVSINPPLAESIRLMKKGAFSIAMQKPHLNKGNLKLFAEMGISAFALDMIPRTTRAQYMDVLSSQSSLAGYRAVIEAAHMLDRAFPMMMTTAGTIPATKVFIAGAGVAGLQAIATAKRLGAIVHAFDVRASAKEQVQSLGAKFVDIDEEKATDGVYATEMSDDYKKRQEEKITNIIHQYDVIITTAQIPFKKAPIIITKGMVGLMKSDSIIIDLASETGGNCELTKHGDVVVSGNNVKIVSFPNILSGIASDASKLFAKNVYEFITLLLDKFDKTQAVTEIDDEIIAGTLLTHNFEIVNERFRGD